MRLCESDLPLGPEKRGSLVYVCVLCVSAVCVCLSVGRCMCDVCVTFRDPLVFWQHIPKEKHRFHIPLKNEELSMWSQSIFGNGGIAGRGSLLQLWAPLVSFA